MWTVVRPNTLEPPIACTKFRIDSTDCDATIMSSDNSLLPWICGRTVISRTLGGVTFSRSPKIRVQLTALRDSKPVQENTAVEHIGICRLTEQPFQRAFSR